MGRLLGLDDVWYVLGYIDSYGAIHAREIPPRCTAVHSDAERMAGRCWKWSIPSQDFLDTLADMKFDSQNRLSHDDNVIVRDWLERSGYKDAED